MPKLHTLRQAFVITTTTVTLGVTMVAGCEGEVGVGNSPDCPGAVPDSGDNCDGDLECRYDEICPGQHQWARCNGGSWDIDTPPPCNPPPPTTCPTQMPSDTNYTCDEVGLQCYYGLDACGQEVVFICTEEQHWQSLVSCYPAECPAELPVHGAECVEQSGTHPSFPAGCSYNATTPCGPSEVSASCKFSELAGVHTWEVTLETPCTAGAEACGSYLHESLCDADSSCRWLAPPVCGSGTIAQVTAGCYAAGDCSQSGCGGWGSCEMVEHDPCYQQYCDACVGETNACMPL